jgi:hypothetical protein
MEGHFHKFSDLASMCSFEYICVYMYVCEHCRLLVPEDEKQDIRFRVKKDDSRTSIW